MMSLLNWTDFGCDRTGFGDWDYWLLVNWFLVAGFRGLGLLVAGEQVSGCLFLRLFQV